MNESLPVWQDESAAGSLFPNARPIPTRWIATDYGAVATADEFRAREQADATRREARREMKRSPEAQEAEWRAAREKARAEMRRERRQERVAAGIETQETATFNQQMLSAFATPSPLLRAAAAEQERLAKAANAAPETAQTFPAYDAWAQQAAEMTKARDALHQAALQPWARDDAHQRTIMRIVDDLTAFSEPKPPKSLKARPERERYLPGTRHSGKGRRL